MYGGEVQNCRGAFLSHCQIGPAPPPPATEYRRFSTTQSKTTIPDKLDVEDDSNKIYRRVATDISVVESAVALSL